MTSAQTRRWKRRARVHICPFCRGSSWLTGSRLRWVWLCAVVVAMAMVQGFLTMTVWLLDLAVAVKAW